MIVQQLDMALIDEFVNAGKIVLVDAAITGQDVNFYLSKNEEIFSISSSHHMNANLLVFLTKKLYEKEINVMVCAVRGENFDLGEQLSATAKQNADKAVDLIVNWIQTRD